MSILFTYGLQFCVPSEIVWNEIKHKVSSKYENLAYYTMRGSLILGTGTYLSVYPRYRSFTLSTSARFTILVIAVILAIIVPNLGPFIGLVGALCLASLGLFTPAMIEMVTYWEDERNSYRILKNGLIMIFSLMVTATGTYVSVEEIVREYLK